MSARDTKYRILHTSAYTLIEILVSMTIIGLLFAFGIANYRDFARRKALSGTAEAVRGDLRLAQSYAITGKKPNDPDCNPPDNTLDSYSLRINSQSEYIIEANCSGGIVSVKDVNLASGMTISTDATDNTVKFKVLGQGTNIGTTDAVITVTQLATGTSLDVTVTSGGEIK